MQEMRNEEIGHGDESRAWEAEEYFEEGFRGGKA
jgi:hypothetical protein